jgi:myosin-crossreactive antigen
MRRDDHSTKRGVGVREDHCDRAATKIYLVGGGIASLAAAVELERALWTLSRH